MTCFSLCLVRLFQSLCHPNPFLFSFLFSMVKQGWFLMVNSISIDIMFLLFIVLCFVCCWHFMKELMLLTLCSGLFLKTIPFSCTCKPSFYSKIFICEKYPLKLSNCLYQLSWDQILVINLPWHIGTCYMCMLHAQLVHCISSLPFVFWKPTETSLKQNYIPFPYTKLKLFNNQYPSSQTVQTCVIFFL